MRIAFHLAAGLVACALATGLVLLIAHGAEHLQNNPPAVAIFLAGAGLGICLPAALVAAIRSRRSGRGFADLWWRSLVPVAGLLLAALLVLEVTAA